MIFSEKRYAQKILANLQEKRELAITHGGDISYFNRLIDLWSIYFKQQK